MTITNPDAPVNPNAPGSAYQSSTYASQVPGAGPDPNTAEGFATAVLNGLAAKTGVPYPATAANISWIASWIAREGGGGANNPLNTTQVTDSSTLLKGNSAGVRNYTSITDGVAATVTTLLNGHYPNILGALRSGDALSADRAGHLANDLSTWSGRGYTSVASTAPNLNRMVGGATADSSSSFNQWLTATEPGLASLANDPQVGPLLLAFYTNGPDWQTQFTQQLSQTNWFKNTPFDQRQKLIDQATDPGTLAQGLSNKQNYISTQAQQLGINLTPSEVNSLAQQWQGNGGWSANQIRQAIAAHSPTVQGATKGEAATDINTLQALYKSYLLEATPQQLNTQLQSVLAGTQTLQSIQSSLAQQAKLLYSNNPQLAANIGDDASHTTRALLDPLISRAANVLGKDANTIDPSNPQWGFLTKPQTDPNTGQSTGMMWSLDDLQKKIEQDPTFGFSSTTNGIKAGTDIVANLQQAFTGRGGI